MIRLLPGDIVEVTMGLGTVDQRREVVKVHNAKHPTTVWVTLKDGNVIRRNRVKHEVIKVEKEGAQKVPDKPDEPLIPEPRKEDKKGTLDDIFNDLLTS